VINYHQIAVEISFNFWGS